MSRARVVIVAFAVVGTLVSAYLTWLHYSGSLALCLGVGGCEAVQASRYSTIGPVPVALVGLVGFAGILTAAMVYALGRGAALTALFALSLGATVYVAYLTYVEIFVLGAVCPWCVSVAVCAMAVLLLAVREIVIGPAD